MQSRNSGGFFQKPGERRQSRRDTGRVGTQSGESVGGHGNWLGKLVGCRGTARGKYQEASSDSALGGGGMMGGFGVLVLVPWWCKYTIFFVLYSEWLDSRCILVWKGKEEN